METSQYNVLTQDHLLFNKHHNYAAKQITLNKPPQRRLNIVHQRYLIYSELKMQAKEGKCL